MMDRNIKYGLLPKYEGASLTNLYRGTPKLIRKILVKHKEVTKEKFYINRLSFFITSEYRVGKTWALHAIANDIIDRFGEKSVYYITAGDLQGAFTDFNDLSNSKHNLVSTLAGKVVLFIDDMGLEYRKEQSDFVRAKMEHFLRWRIANNKITYIASKIYGEDFIYFYNKSLYAFIIGEYVDICIKEKINIGKLVLEKKLSKK